VHGENRSDVAYPENMLQVSGFGSAGLAAKSAMSWNTVWCKIGVFREDSDEHHGQEANIQSDPYLYPDTSVLCNLADIRDASRLSQFESDPAKDRWKVVFHNLSRRV
jgi:hypothetical protein